MLSGLCRRLAALWRPDRTPPIAVVVYTRAQCHLCDKAAEVLERYRGRYRLAIEFRDIDRDSALLEKFNEWVPVVEIEGEVRFRGTVNEILLIRQLDHLRSKREHQPGK